MYVISSSSHARIQKVLPEGSNFEGFLGVCLVVERREDPNTTICGPTSARQRNAIKWRFACVPLVAQHCWLGSLVLFQEIRTTIAMKPYIPVILQGGGDLDHLPPPPPPPPPWIRTCFLPGNDLLTNPLIRNFFTFPSNNMFSLILGKTCYGIWLENIMSTL